MAQAPRRRTTGNALLDELAPDALERFMPRMTRRRFPAGSIFTSPHRRTGGLYYITRGVAADIVDTDDGISVVASMVGSEGMIGLPLVLGVPGMEGRWLWLVDGEAWRVPSGLLSGDLREALTRFAAAELAEKRLATACHATHSVEQRIARYMLEVVERIDHFQELALTHDQLSVMVGVTRPRVSSALENLERAGGIFRGRKRILIRNVHRLQKFACRCLVLVQRIHHSLNLSWHDAP